MQYAIAMDMISQGVVCVVSSVVQEMTEEETEIEMSEVEVQVVVGRSSE